MDSTTFRTTFPIPPAPFQLTERSRILALGSCFADTIGARLKDSKVVACVNPFGVLFQPLAMTNLVNMALAGGTPDPRLFCERDGVWVSHEAHSVVCGRSPQELEEQFTARLKGFREDLGRADVLMLTLGTAWVQQLKDPAVVVANNHKRPAACFVSQLLTVESVRDALVSVLDSVGRVNPGLRVILTVSPVRHTRSGMAENAVSKAVLRLAAHELLSHRPEVYYFPAYELMLDDLRDYRFYGADGLHPSVVAAEYIFEQFLKSCYTADARALFAEWEGIRAGLGHRPLQPGTVAHRAFLSQLHKRLVDISGRLDVAVELESVRSRLRIFDS